MDIKNLVLSDEAIKVIEEGAWVESGINGVSFKVLAFSSKKGRKAMQSKAFSARAKGEEVDNTKIAIEVLAETLLLDWKGLTDNGEQLEFSRELAVKFITDPNGERFADLVFNAVNSLDQNFNDYVDQVSKN